MPLFRRYNGMFSMHSPRESWANQACDPAHQLVSPDECSPQGQSSNSPTETESFGRETKVKKVSAVASPCTGVCVLSNSSDICTGCFRTKAEISSWMRVSDSERSLIVKRSGQRKYSAEIVGDGASRVELCTKLEDAENRDSKP